MSDDANKAIARRALEVVWGEGDLAAADDVYSPTFVSRQHSHPEAGDVVDLDALKGFVREFRDAFPDFTDTVDQQVAEGDLVVTRFTSAGTHRGALMGVAPTGRRVSWMGITIDRIEDGRIAESWVSWDMMGMMQQLGAA